MVIPTGEWQRRFDHLIENIHKKSIQYPAEEIEANISQAVKEVREEKRGR